MRCRKNGFGKMKQISTNVGRQARKHNLDFIKGLSILFVVITHYSWNNTQRLTMFFLFWIDMAVPIFMIISGFLFSISYHKNECATLKECFRIKDILKRIIRFTVPYLMMTIAEQLSLFLIFDKLTSIKEMVRNFVSGGIGPGSYYYPILLQFIIIMPLIYFFINKFDYKGLLGCVSVNLIFEIVKSGLFISEGAYRLLIFRYITVIAFGCYFAIGKNQLKAGLKLSMLFFGVIYIIVFQYFGYTPFFMKYWTGTSMFACMYIIPIVSLLIRCDRIKFAPIELLGRASYNIFLSQMVFYAFFADLIYSVLNNMFLQLLISILICVLSGVGFYFLETPFTRKLIRVLNLS